MAGVIEGNSLRAYQGSNPVGYATSATLEMSAETKQRIHKDNPTGNWATVTVSTRSATLNVEFLYSEDTTVNGNTRTPSTDIFDAFAAGTQLTMKMSTGTTGEEEYTFSAYCTSLSINSPVDEDVTASATFTVDGAISIAAIV
ncbi:MAG: phage tail tube protein [Flavobacteriaceae bacterium]